MGWDESNCWFEIEVPTLSCTHAVKPPGQRNMCFEPLPSPHQISGSGFTCLGPRTTRRTCARAHELGTCKDTDELQRLVGWNECSLGLWRLSRSRLLASIWSANPGALQPSYATRALGLHQTQALRSVPKLHCTATRAHFKCKPCALDRVPWAAKHGPRALHFPSIFRLGQHVSGYRRHDERALQPPNLIGVATSCGWVGG
jgi:hypothetical protein